MKVRYDGSNEPGYYGFGSGIAKLLVPGEEYDVKYIRVLPSETLLVLKGIDTKGTDLEGVKLNDIDLEFNSCWFEEVPSDDGVYMAYANHTPVVGECMKCYKLDMNDEDYFIECTTSPVREVFRVTSELAHIYHVVTTDGSNYVVDVHR